MLTIETGWENQDFLNNKITHIIIRKENNMRLFLNKFKTGGENKSQKRFTNFIKKKVSVYRQDEKEFTWILYSPTGTTKTVIQF